jgi:hypothetical protein
MGLLLIVLYQHSLNRLLMNWFRLNMQGMDVMNDCSFQSGSNVREPIDMPYEVQERKQDSESNTQMRTKCRAVSSWSMHSMLAVACFLTITITSRIDLIAFRLVVLGALLAPL